MLVALSGALTDALCPLDILGRLGGEAFGVILPETGADGAEQAAERLRDAVSRVRAPVGAVELGFTVGIGATPFAAGETGLKPAVDRADAALYLAKTQGRDRVVLAESPAGDSASHSMSLHPAHA